MVLKIDSSKCGDTSGQSLRTRERERLQSIWYLTGRSGIKLKRLANLRINLLPCGRPFRIPLRIKLYFLQNYLVKSLLAEPLVLGGELHLAGVFCRLGDDGTSGHFCRYGWRRWRELSGIIHLLLLLNLTVPVNSLTLIICFLILLLLLLLFFCRRSGENVIDWPTLEAEKRML